METINVDNIYNCYIQSEKYEEVELKRNDIELDWLKNNLTTKDFMLLEEKITNFVQDFEKDAFKSGFLIAQNILMQCL